MSYSHTQNAPLKQIFYLLMIASCSMIYFSRDEPYVMAIFIVLSLALALVALSFGSLTVEDEGEHLALRYGPLPVFKKLIPYKDITAVARGRSAIIDGWGIHWVPGRGWTYNLWGLDCVVLTVNGRTLRVGSDDVDGLDEFLRTKCG